MLDDDDVTDDATRRLNELLGRMQQGRAPPPIPEADWRACTNASLMLALAERRAPVGDYLRALAACARAALAVRSTPVPALEEQCQVVERVARGEASAADARAAAGRAWCYVSRSVAGCDDDVGLAVMEACELAAGDRFDCYAPNPAFRCAWAMAQHDGAKDLRVAQRRHEATLADLVRTLIPALR